MKCESFSSEYCFVFVNRFEMFLSPSNILYFIIGVFVAIPAKSASHSILSSLINIKIIIVQCGLIIFLNSILELPVIRQQITILCPMREHAASQPKLVFLHNPTQKPFQ